MPRVSKTTPVAITPASTAPAPAPAPSAPAVPASGGDYWYDVASESCISVPTYKITFTMRVDGHAATQHDIAILDKMLGGQTWGIPETPGSVGRKDTPLKIVLNRCEKGISVFQSPLAYEIIAKLTDGIMKCVGSQMLALPRYHGKKVGLTKHVINMRTVIVPRMAPTPLILNHGVSQFVGGETTSAAGRPAITRSRVRKVIAIYQAIDKALEEKAATTTTDTSNPNPNPDSTTPL